MNFEDIYNKEENKEKRVKLRYKVYEVFDLFDEFCKLNGIETKHFELLIRADDDINLSIRYFREKVYATHI